MPTEISDSPDVKVLSPERIAQDQAAAQAKAAPRESQAPMDGADSDVIGHPSDSFKNMADILDKEMKGLGKKESATPITDASPKENMQQTDSARKPAEDPNAAPADPNKPADDKPAEDKVFTSAKAADWKALKEKIAQAEAQRKEIETKYQMTVKEYEEFKKASLPSTEAERIRAEVKTISEAKLKLEEELTRNALERTEKFSTFYQQQFDSAVARAKDAVPDDQKEKVAHLLELPPSKIRKELLSAIIEDLNPLDQSELGHAVVDYDKARAERTAKLADAKNQMQKLKEVESAEAANQAELSKRRQDAMISSVLSVAKQNFKDAFVASGDKAIDSAVMENEAFVEKFFRGTLPENEMALVPVVAIEGRRLATTVIPAMTKEIAELKSALKQYQAGNPPVSGGSPAKPGGGSGGEKTFQQVFQENWPAGNR